jgi:hypothetical protein
LLLEAQTDPYTAVQVIAGVISALNGISGAASEDRWEKEASGKLDFIIQQNGEILTQLRDLGILFPQLLDQKFNQEEGLQATALSRRFDLYMSSRPPNIAGIRGMESSVEQVAYDLAGRGPAVYEAFDASAVLGLAVYKMAGNVSDKQRARFGADMLNQMQVWAGTQPGMFGDAIAKTQAALADAQSALAQIPSGNDVVIATQNSVVCVTTGSHHGPCVPCPLSLHANVTVDAGHFTESVTPTRTTGPGPCSALSFSGDAAGNAARAYSARIQVELDQIKAQGSRLQQLQGYEAALTQMIVDYKKLL